MRMKERRDSAERGTCCMRAANATETEVQIVAWLEFRALCRLQVLHPQLVTQCAVSDRVRFAT
jgi:hypothetical protein